MIDELDSILQAILKDGNAPPIVNGADIDFAIPRTEYENGVQDRTLNLYLYDVHENRQLRDPIPIIERIGDTYVKRPPPLRVDCSYMVTAWSVKQGEVMPDEEHRLLSFAMLWLSRFPTIPETFLPDEWKDKTKATFQPFPLLMWIAQMDGVKEPGEFWAALGSPPRPFFNLVVTIAMDLRKEMEEVPPVTANVTFYGQKQEDKELLIPETRETFIQIGGRVFHAADPEKEIEGAKLILKGPLTPSPTPAPAARLEPHTQTATTDENGSYTFTRVTAGTYTVRVNALGFHVLEKNIGIPGSPEEYEFGLTATG